MAVTIHSHNSAVEGDTIRLVGVAVEEDEDGSGT